MGVWLICAPLADVQAQAPDRTYSPDESGLNRAAAAIGLPDTAPVTGAGSRAGAFRSDRSDLRIRTAWRDLADSLANSPDHADTLTASPAASGIGGARPGRAAPPAARSASRDTLRLPRLSGRLLPEPFPRQRSGLLAIDHPEDRIVRTRRPDGSFEIRREIFGIRSGYSRRLDFESYTAHHRERGKRENWQQLIAEAREQDVDQRGLLDFTVDLPAGERSAFTTIFGRPEVNLNITGTANMDVGASIRDTENPALPPDQQRRVDPLFNQNLQLNIEGTIGDKLHLRTDWDTNREFEFQNRLNIFYQGYEDEILQSVELGNVSMETGNSLVRGGGSLFGIKSQAQFGPLTLTSVLSQKGGEDNTETISDGSQEAELNIAPTDYEHDRHFFLDFYTRQEFEDAMADPVVSRRVIELTRLDVYVLNVRSEAVEGQRRAIALSELGVHRQNGVYQLPDPGQDRFDEQQLQTYRDPETSVSAADLGVESDEFEEGMFIPLEEGVDYTYEEELGTISLDSRLEPRQALAVSYAYRGPDGEIVDVGNVNTGENDRMFLKLLRPSNITPASSAWDLMMRNVYSVDAENLARDEIELNIYYTGDNTDQRNLPGRGEELLQDLGLDRVNEDGESRPDNQLDFGTGTFDAAQGRIIFPYLEPFGERIRQLYLDSGLTDAEAQEMIDRYAFPELYENTRSNAERNSKDNIYRMKGVTRGGVQDSYYLGFALVEGSVRVTANGRGLEEGVDYEVDHSIGNIEIINDRYLHTGQEIVINYESQRMMQVQQTTLTGLRADYRVSDAFTMGGTWMRMHERPMQDKIRVGDEPVSNQVMGFDADGDFDLPWLTRLLNRVPQLNSDAGSHFTISGEFARSSPSPVHSRAVERAMERGDLHPDEERGISYIDHFEGARNTIDFTSPTRWHLAAPPHAVPGYDGDMDSDDQSVAARLERNDLRSKFSWYMLPQNLSRVTDAPRTPETRQVHVNDVFPNRDVTRDREYLQTLDVHYDPTRRGPYNYNMNLQALLRDEPQRTWGGMTAVLPSGQDDLTQNNIEFLEFWVQPVLPDGEAPTPEDLQSYDGTIYIDVGVVSEDVIPNNRLNTEDGLARARTLRLDQPERSLVPRSLGELTGQFSSETLQQEDVGLDGLPSSEGDGLTEQQVFAEFIEQMEQDFSGQPERVERIRRDPSNDEFVYFQDSRMQDRPLHERFHRMYAYPEGNASAEGESRSVTNRPDTEGLVNPATVNLENSYYQFEIPFNPADTTGLEPGEHFVVDQVPGATQTERWYQVRLPLREFVRQVGDIQDLERVSHIRFWMSGYEKPLTLRFATFELVGNEWTRSRINDNQGDDDSVFDVGTINIEENAHREPIPYRIPTGAIRSIDRGQQQHTLANEQSLTMNVGRLNPGRLSMVERLYPGGLDLLNYSNLRMFVHGEGYERRAEAELVIRLGNDLEHNYYEYRQPVSPTDPDRYFTPPPLEDIEQSVLEAETRRIWKPDSNSVNLQLERLNQLKQARDVEGVEPNRKYERADLAGDAPNGTVLAVKGNPSLDQVTEIGIGIRNPDDDQTDDGVDLSRRGTASLDAEFWVNEMRLSGYEEGGGIKANVQAELQLSDFATVSMNYERSTEGFGPLNARMDERQRHVEYGLNVSSTMQMQRFLPERYGWNMPVSLSARQREVTPQFLPREGDVRFSDFEEAVRQSDLSELQQEEMLRSRLEQIRTTRREYSVSLPNVSKSGSQTPLVRYTLDNTRYSFVWNRREASNPNLMFDDNWDYRTGLDYQASISEPDRLEPFRFFEGIPVLQAFAGTGFSYLPSSVNASANLSRRYGENRQRHFGDQDPFDVRQTHTFGFQSDFGLNHRLTRSITASFNTRTRFNLARAGEQVLDEETGEFALRSTFESLERLFTEPDVTPRRSELQENYNASWRPQLDRISLLGWLGYTASFNGRFQWTNAPRGSGLGAELNNSFSLEQNPQIRTQQLLELIPWYESARRADRNRDTEAGGGPMDTVTDYGRSLLLALLSIQDLNISYTHSGTSRQSGYTGGSQIYYMFADERHATFSPDFAYRTGLRNEIPVSQLVRPDDPETALDIRTQKTFSDHISLRTGLQPASNITVDLDWSTGWDETRDRRMRMFVDDMSSEQSLNGSVSASVWAFGEGYQELFRRQLQRALDAMQNGFELQQREAGQTVLSSLSLQQDFREAYVNPGSGPVGERGFTPLPLPDWSVVWGGWRQYMPFLADRLTSASLNHAYRGEYRMRWRSNQDVGSEVRQSIGSYGLQYERPEYQGRTVTLEKHFEPLIGANLTWLQDLRTNVNYNRSEIISFSLSNNNVTERLSRGVSLTVGYSVRGFRIPYFRRLSNQLDLDLTMSYNRDLTLVYRLNEDINEVLQSPPDELASDADAYTAASPEERGDSRIQVTPSFRYRFSEIVTASFEYSFRRLMPRSTNVFPRTDQDIRFNIVISIRSN